MAVSNGYCESPCGRYVMLGGLALPLAPILLADDLERRGFHLERDGDDLAIAPWSQLTDDDLARLRRWKPHVLALIDYCARQAVIQ